MSENHCPYKRQRTTAKENLKFYSDTTFSIEEGSHVPRNSNITKWGSPYHLDSSEKFLDINLQFGPSALENYPYQDTQHINEDTVPAMRYTSTYPTIPPISEMAGKNLTLNLESPSIAHHPDSFHMANSNIHIPKLFTDTTEKSFPSSPVDYSISSSLNKLLRQISQAPATKSTYSHMYPIHSPMEEDMLKAHHLASIINFSHLPSQSQSTPYTGDQESLGTKSQSLQYPDASKIDKIPNEFELSQDILDSFARLYPLLKKINSRNCSEELVELLKKFHQNISLDDFFNLLYNESPTFERFGSLKVSYKEPSDTTGLELKTLKIFHLVLLTFQYPKATISLLPNVFAQNMRVSATKFQDILRTFLAIKIIFATVKKVNYPLMLNFSVSRVSIYKVYYILCQKLIKKYPIVSDHPGFRESLLLGQSRLGKITNLIFPNMITKRLGKRGESKCHYIGLTLDYSIVDQDIVRLLELDIPQIKDYFQEKREVTSEGHMNLVRGIEQSTKERNIFPSEKKSSLPQPRPGSQNSLPTYIDTRYPNPDLDHSPCMSKQEPPKIKERTKMGPKLIWKQFQKP